MGRGLDETHGSVEHCSGLETWERIQAHAGIASRLSGLDDGLGQPPSEAGAPPRWAHEEALHFADPQLKRPHAYAAGDGTIEHARQQQGSRRRRVPAKQIVDLFSKILETQVDTQPLLVFDEQRTDLRHVGGRFRFGDGGIFVHSAHIETLDMAPLIHD